MTKIEGYKQLTRDEQRELCRRRDAGDETAVVELMRSIEPMARGMAVKFARFRNWDVDEAINAAIEGTWRAAQKLDPENASMTTYGHWWIRAKLGRAYMTEGPGCGRAIRLPISSRESDPEAYAKARSVISFAAKAREHDGENPLIQAVTHDTPADAAERSDEQQLQRWRLDRAMSVLTERERDVLVRRFVNGEILDDVGAIYGITCERVRQIEMKALEQVRTMYARGMLHPRRPAHATNGSRSNPKPLTVVENSMSDDYQEKQLSVLDLVNRLTPQAVASELAALDAQFEKYKTAWATQRKKLLALHKSLGGVATKAKGAARGRSTTAAPREGTFTRDVWDLLRNAGEPLAVSVIAKKVGRKLANVSSLLSSNRDKWFTSADGKWSAISPAA